MNIKHLLISVFGFLTVALCAQTNYPNNEDGQFEDMLTPEYYNTPDGAPFRLELNKFVHFARQIDFQHPLEDSLAQSPVYAIHRGFGVGIGPGGMGSHHPAFDYHVGNASTLVNMYAVYDGYVSISKEVGRYRHYLSITTDVQDSSGTNIGKMVALYGHVDLDLDSAANLSLDGQYVSKGDLVSKHLYSGTVGGPHLHFEIRYYRTNDSAIEDFYGGPVGDKTAPSSGSWTYGFWNPDVGYGFAHPLNHLNSASTNLSENNQYDQIKVYPNPTEDLITVEFTRPQGINALTILTIAGQEKFHQDFIEDKIVSIRMRDYQSGIYLLKISDNNRIITKLIVKK